MINEEGRMVAKLTPVRIDYPFPAGKDSSKNPDIYRSGIVISSAPLLVNVRIIELVMCYVLKVG